MITPHRILPNPPSSDFQPFLTSGAVAWPNAVASYTLTGMSGNPVVENRDFYPPLVRAAFHRLALD